MNRIKTTQAVRTIAAWMGQTIKTGEPIPVDQVSAWQKALLTALEGLEGRETAARLIEDQKDRIRDRVPVAYAEQLTCSISKAVKRLADHACQAATLKELDEIDRDACAIVDGFELLTIGVVRPANSNTETGA